MNKIIQYIAAAIILLVHLQTMAQTKTNENTKMTITYIMDPQCGWCYGNSENITALYEKFNGDFNFELMVGGMLLGRNAPYGGNQFIQFLQNHTPRMVSVTGAYVDKSYYERAQDPSYQFSSLEPCAAIQLVKEEHPEKTFLFAKQVQRALFTEGKRLDKIETYQEILKDMSVEISDFENRWMSKDNLVVLQQEFSKAGKLANGFPTLVITRNGKTETLASGYFDKDEMIRKLERLK